MRPSNNHSVKDGYDYALQVWVVDGVVLPCNHPPKMRVGGSCCPQHLYEGVPVSEIPGHQGSFIADTTRAQKEAE